MSVPLTPNLRRSLHAIAQSGTRATRSSPAVLSPAAVAPLFLLPLGGLSPESDHWYFRPARGWPDHLPWSTRGCPCARPAFTRAGAGSYSRLFHMAFPAAETSVGPPSPGGSLWTVHVWCSCRSLGYGWRSTWDGSCQGPSSRVRNIGYLGPVVRCGWPECCGSPSTGTAVHRWI